MKAIFGTLLAVLVVGIAGVAFVVESGACSIGVTEHGHGLVDRALASAMAHSVRRHASEIRVPNLDDPSAVRMGFDHYDEMCVTCHGAPGADPDEIASGLWPKAPDLTKAADRWKPQELFWIVKHGIRFTAMPAWGPTHDDKMIWAMVALMEKLPHLDPAEYQAMKARKKSDNHEH